MRICSNNYNYNNNYKTYKTNPTFTADNTPKAVKTCASHSKLATWIIGLATLFNISCSDDPNKRYSTVEEKNGVTVEYTDVKKETRDSIMTPVYELKSKLHNKNDFLEGLKINVVSTFDSLKPTNSFTEYLRNNSATNMKGTSFYSDSRLPKRIAIQENAHKGYETYIPGTHKETLVPTLRQSMMHEVGHQFDNYFGHNHNADYALKWDSLVAEKEASLYYTPYDFDLTSKPERLLRVKYTWDSGLSDKKEFHKALLQDLNELREIPENSGELPQNLKYYTSGFDFKKVITPEDVDLADGARAEIYANLFSYASGQDDGESKQFIKCFKNCYNVVKKDMKKFLK